MFLEEDGFVQYVSLQCYKYLLGTHIANVGLAFPEIQLKCKRRNKYTNKPKETLSSKLKMKESWIIHFFPT